MKEEKKPQSDRLCKDFTMAVIVYLHGGVHTALIMDPEIDSGIGLRWEE